MNRRGVAILAGLIGYVCITAVVLGTLDFAKDTNGQVKSIKVNDQTKKNGKIIWCKVLNKGEAYCNSL